MVAKVRRKQKTVSAPRQGDCNEHRKNGITEAFVLEVLLLDLLNVSLVPNNIRREQRDTEQDVHNYVSREQFRLPNRSSGEEILLPSHAGRSRTEGINPLSKS